MASTIESEIREALATVLRAACPWAKVVEPYRIRTGVSELREHEIPYVQFYGLGQTYEPARTEVLTRWQVGVDLVLRKGTDGTVDQRDLDDKRNEILEAVGAANEGRFGGLPVIQVVPVSSSDDLNTYDPHFVTTIVFEFLYRKPFVREC